MSKQSSSLQRCSYIDVTCSAWRIHIFPMGSCEQRPGISQLLRLPVLGPFPRQTPHLRQTALLRQTLPWAAPVCLFLGALELPARAQLAWSFVPPDAPQPAAWGASGQLQTIPPSSPSWTRPGPVATSAQAAPGQSAGPVAAAASLATRSPASQTSQPRPVTTQGNASAAGRSGFTVAAASGMAETAAARSGSQAVAATPTSPTRSPAPVASGSGRPVSIPGGASVAAAPGFPTLGAATAAPQPRLATTSPSAVAASPRQVSPAAATFTAQAVPAPAPATSLTPDERRKLLERLRIPPIARREKPWPAPALAPGVPSGFVANWGDVFLGLSGATPGNQRDGVVDGSWTAGFGLGSSTESIGVEISGGCGSVRNFCANGSFTTRVGRLLINQPNARLGVAAAWQNLVQWGNEGRQDNVYYGALSLGFPLRPGQTFAQTMQVNVGVGNSQYAPFVAEGSESKIGGFASVGLELTRFMGLSAGWSGRGANAQISITPVRDLPITVNLLGADLLNQTPSGTVAVLSISWGTNFLTPSF